MAARFSVAIFHLTRLPSHLLTLKFADRHSQSLQLSIVICSIISYHSIVDTQQAALMSGKGDLVEWVETTEEVIISEECLPTNGNASSEPPDTPIQKLLDTMVQGEDAGLDDGFYCEECRSLFQDQSGLSGINGPSFILDSPTNVGVPQRALLTLPHGLMIGRSSLPNAGLGVINQGPAVSPGMHFGPYEGEVTTRETALASDFSWEIYKGKDEEYEYIDASRESHSNWMRYVNCARNEDEKNLLAVQYKDSVLFHCCRTIHPGDELVVWPSPKLLSRLSQAWTQIWVMKLTPKESNTSAASHIFLCTHCQLSFTTEAYLQRHTRNFHRQPQDDCVEAAGGGGPSPGDGPQHPAPGSLVVLTVDPFESKTCPDCGKIFKHGHHLKRHKLCVHSNQRPYCCPQCRRSFSQASGLLRHQQVHRNQGLIDDRDLAPGLDQIPSEEMESSERDGGGEPIAAEVPPATTEAEAIDKPSESECLPPAEADGGQEEPIQQSSVCAKCDKTFMNECHLKKHTLSVHSNLRPYVCTICRKCFGQHSDLARHVKCHQNKRKRKAESRVPVETNAFDCPSCLQAFPSEDALQEHSALHHSEEVAQTSPRASEGSPGEESSASADDRQDEDPNFIVRPSVAIKAESTQQPLRQRPQRRGTRSRISAITRLIAPKQRANVGRKAMQSSAESTESCSHTEAPDANRSPKEGDAKKLKNSSWYSCSHCKEMYKNKDHLTAHSCTTEQHKCIQCGAAFKKSGFLKRHERIVHVDTKSYTCEVCDKVFSKLGNLQQHQKAKSCEKHHCTAELFTCPYCQFSFTMKSYLRKHIRRHHPVEFLSDGQGNQLGDDDKDLSCPHCGQDYVSAKHFKAHSCFQQVRIVYLCTDCGKGFTNHFSLKQHQRVHTGEKPYGCPHCGKSFSYSGQLNVHIRTHTGEKPYLCTHCGESFRQSGDLKRHERKHTGVRPYTCPDCLKSFSRPQSLKAHRMLHLGQKMYKCGQCGKSFSRSYHLRRHHQKMHL